MSRRRTTFCCLAISLAAALAPAQVVDLVQDPGEKARNAIAAYEALKGDPKKATQRQKAIVWLGEIDHADATAFLRAELKAAGDTPFATSVVDGIGKVARPELKPDLMALVAREKAPLPARVIQKTLVGGDAKSRPIMAASILAKVARDREKKERPAQPPVPKPAHVNPVNPETT